MKNKRTRDAMSPMFMMVVGIIAVAFGAVFDAPALYVIGGILMVSAIAIAVHQDIMWRRDNKK